MPSIDFHVRRSKTKPRIARRIHSELDNPAGVWLGKRAHAIWRKMTHKPEVAMMIGWVHGGALGAADALRHILDDELFITLYNESSMYIKSPSDYDESEEEDEEEIEEEQSEEWEEEEDEGDES